MYTTAEVAERIGVSKNTLLRWIGEGRLPDVERDWRNWRHWSEADLARARAVRGEIHGAPTAAPAVPTEPPKIAEIVSYADDLNRLGQGRQHRLPERSTANTAKADRLPVLAHDLLRLGEGRSHRAQPHS